MLSVNAQIPDGRDTSWLWDVDYRRLRGRPVLVGGRAAGRPGGAPGGRRGGRSTWSSGIDEAVDRVRPGGLDVIANYTAFQQIRTPSAAA